MIIQEAVAKSAESLTILSEIFFRRIGGNIYMRQGNSRRLYWKNRGFEIFRLAFQFVDNFYRFLYYFYALNRIKHKILIHIQFENDSKDYLVISSCNATDCKVRDQGNPVYPG